MGKSRGCVSLRAMQSDILHVRGPRCLFCSPGLFPLCLLFIHASCNSIAILHSQYLLSLPSDYNTIHLQEEAIGFSFYMQSISMPWPLTLQLVFSHAGCVCICQPAPSIGNKSSSDKGRSSCFDFNTCDGLEQWSLCLSDCLL